MWSITGVFWSSRHHHMPASGSLSQEMAIESILASSTASIISRLCCHPLDTAKVRSDVAFASIRRSFATGAFQARLQNPGSEYRSTRQVVQQTIRQEGISGLYRGLGTVISLGTPAFVVYLSTYEACKHYLCSYPVLDRHPSIGHFISGMTAETVSCLLYVPVDVTKERLQVQRRLLSGQEVAGELPMYKGTWHALTTILEHEGFRGIYRGYGATLLSFGPFSAFYFAFYEQLKAFSAQQAGVDQRDIPFYLTLLSAASAGALASWITNPLDLVRLRLQVQRGAARSPSPTPTQPSTPITPSPVVSTTPSPKTSPQPNVFATVPGLDAKTATPVADAVTGASARLATSLSTSSAAQAASAAAARGTASASSMTAFTAAGIAGVVMKEAQQGVGGREGYRNTWDGLRQIMRKDGLLGLFRGSGARILFHTPSTMISMACYDEIKKWWGRVFVER